MKLKKALTPEQLGPMMQKALRMAGKGSLADDPEALKAAFEAGWRASAALAKRDDLIADIDSPAYIVVRDAALANPKPALEQP